MKKLVALVLSIAMVLSLALVSTVSAAGTFCADLFELRRADGSVAANVGAVADMGQIKGYVDDGATVIHAQGWYLPESAMEDIGYQHDNGDITWGTAFVDPNIYGPLGSELPLRYNFDAPILEGSHTFKVVARLTNGEIVTAHETTYVNDDSVIAEWANINTGSDSAGIGLWLKQPGQYAAAAFTATEGFDAVRTPINWSSRPDKDQPQTYEMLIYRFVNNIENSLSKTPLVRQEYAPEGDHGGGDVMEFDTLPKGQYVFVIRLLTAENGGYFVLPVNGNTGKAVYETNVGDGTQTFNFGIRSYAKDAIYGALPEITDTPDPATVVGSSFDSFYVNDTLNFDEGDGGASAKLDKHDRRVDGSDGSVSRLVIRGWIGFVDEIESFGYKIGDNAPVYGEFRAATEAGVYGAGGPFASRFQITIDPSDLEGENTIVAVVKLLNRDEPVIMDENYNAGNNNTSFTFVGPTAPEKTFSRKDIGTGTAIGVWLQGDNDTATLEFTTAGAFNGFGLPIYWASNAGVPNGPFGKYKVELFKFAYNPEYTLSQAPVKSYELDGQGDNNPAFDFTFDEALKAGTYIVRITLTNKDEILVGKMNGQGDDVEMTPYIVLPKMDANPDASKFAFSTADAFNLYVLAEDGVEDFFAANPENTDVPSDPPQTGDAAVARCAVLAVLAMGAAVVFARKKSY